jgi:hypothetical protein
MERESAVNIDLVSEPMMKKNMSQPLMIQSKISEPNKNGTNSENGLDIISSNLKYA